jgi:hypothetical protein
VYHKHMANVELTNEELAIITLAKLELLYELDCRECHIRKCINCHKLVVIGKGFQGCLCSNCDEVFDVVNGQLSLIE